MRKYVRLSSAREFLLLTLGTAIIAAGVYFFKFPNNFSTGGVTGLAVVAAHYIPWLSQGMTVLVLNLLLLAVGLLVLGRSFGTKTAYCTVLMSLMISGLELVAPMTRPLTNQPLMELFFAVMLPALGSALLFNIGASSGGTDIVAMVLNKYTHINIPIALFATDILIALAAWPAFGVEIALLSVFGLLIKSVSMDSVLESLNLRKYFNIVTENPEPIRKYITEKLSRSATIFHGQGAFSGQPRTLLLVAVDRRQAVQLRLFVREVDPHAFMTITGTSEIIGKGFRSDA